MRFIQRIIFFLGLLLMKPAFAQTERDIFNTANELFALEKYVEATPYYLRLLTLQPKNTFINYRYGACLLYNTDRKLEAMRFLRFAVLAGEEDPLSLFFLAKASHLNYLFNDAIQYYEQYQTKAGKKSAEKYDIARLISMCENGKKLLTRFSEVIVYEKTEIETSKFFRLYDLTDLGGNLLVTEEFQSKIDIKRNHIPIIYFAKGAKEIFYSSFGELDLGHKDLYKRVKGGDGNWSLPIRIEGEVNTMYDEDYVYLSPNGKYLYFSSMGHNSMGGYDVFRCTYDVSTGETGFIENLDFAISSPDDDLLFLVDAQSEFGYFASARQSELGKLYVYKVGIEKVPAQLSIVAAKFESKINKNTSILVEVKDRQTGRIIGNFQSDQDGSLVLTFPKGGQFEYNMRVVGSELKFTQIVDIPTRKLLSPVRQYIVHTAVKGKEVILIDSKFEEEILEEEQDEIIADIFRKKASLDPNSELYDLNKYNLNEESVLEKIGVVKKNMSDIGDDLKMKMQRMRKNQERTKSHEAQKLNEVNQEVNEIEGMEETLQNLLEDYETASLDRYKEAILLEAKNLIEDKNIKARKIESMIREIDDFSSVNSLSSINAENAEKWAFLSDQFNQLLAEGRKSEALQLIAANSDDFKRVFQTDFSDFTDKNTVKLGEFDSKVVLLQETKLNLEAGIKKVEQEVLVLEEKVQNAKRAKLDEAQIELVDKKQVLAVAKSELKSVENRIVSLQKDKESLEQVLLSFNSGTPSDFLLPDTTKLKIEERIYKRRVGTATIAEIYFENEIEKRDLAISEKTNVASVENGISAATQMEEQIKVLDLTLFNDQFSSDFAVQLKPNYYKESTQLKEGIKEDPSLIKGLIEQDQSLLSSVIEYKQNAALDNNTMAKVNEFERKLKEKINDLQITDLARSETDSMNFEKSVPGYHKNLSYIKNDQSLTSQEKIQALVNFERDVIYEMQNRKSYFEKLKSENVDNLVLQNKIAELNRIIEGKRSQLQMLEQNNSAVNQLTSSKPIVVKDRDIATLSENEKNVFEKDESVNDVLFRLGGDVALQNFQSGGYQNANSIEANETELLTANDVLLKIQEELAKTKGLKVSPEQGPLLSKKVKLLEDLYDQQLTKVQYTRTKLQEQKSVAAKQIADLSRQKDQKVTELAIQKQVQEEKEITAKTEAMFEQEMKLAEINEKLQNERAKLLEATNQQLSSIRNNTIDVRTKLMAMAYSPYFVEKTKVLTNASLSEYDFLSDSKTLESNLLNGLKKMENIGNVKVEELPILMELIARSEKNLEEFRMGLILLPETRDRLIFRVLPSYLNTSVNLSIQKPNNDQLTKLNQLDKELIEVLNKEKSKILDFASKNVEAVRIGRKVEEINAVIEQLQADILVREGQMKAFDRSSGDFAKEIAKNNVVSEQAKVYISKLKEIKSIDELRADVLKEKSRIMTDSPDNFDTLVNLRTNLLDYKLDLDLINRFYLSDKTKDFAYSSQLVADEIKRVDRRLKQIEANLRAIEEQNISLSSMAKPNYITAKFNDAQLQKLLDRENELKSKIESLKKAPRSEMKNFARIQNERISRENFLLDKELNTMTKASNEALKEIENLNTNTILSQRNVTIAKSNYYETNRIATEWEQKAARAKRPNLKNYYLQQAATQRKNLEILFERTYVENKIQQVSKGSIATINSIEEIESILRILELEKNRVKAEYTNSKSSYQLATGSRQRATAMQQQELIRLKLKNIEEEEISFQKQLLIQPKNIVSAFNQSAQTTPLTFKEERELAGSQNYKRLSRLGFDLLELETQIAERKRKIQDTKNEIRANIQTKGDPKKEELLNALVEKLATMEKQLEYYSSEQTQKAKTFRDFVDTFSTAGLQMQNMILRGIDPVIPKLKKEEFVPVPVETFAINISNIKTESIPLGVKYPSGLIYRVQLGAYDKPLEGSKFKEYKPVDGTAAVNGLFLYRTGFFKDYSKAKTAESQIRGRSASDAFVVAFCNGERITIQEARRLEKTGGCDAQIEGESNLPLMNQIIVDTNLNQNRSTDSAALVMNESKVDLSYNQGKNALPARAIESIKGLFFTIQIGVFNRPADETLLPGMTDLLTQRMDNGQIRYATGLFSSISLAQSYKIEVIGKGIPDAFITAYFNSERITLADAKKMLETNGDQIFATQAPSTPEENSNSVIQKVAAEDEFVQRNEPVKDYDMMDSKAPLVDPNQPVVSAGQLPNRVQLISKVSYEDFPRDPLNRFNSHAPFFFDANDKKIKSPVYKSIDQIPQVYLLRKEIDTVFFYVDEVAERMETTSNNRIITFDIEENKVDGDLANYLIRLNYRKEYFKKPTALQVDLKEIPESEATKIMAELKIFNIQPRLIIGF